MVGGNGYRLRVRDAFRRAIDGVIVKMSGQTTNPFQRRASRDPGPHHITMAAIKYESMAVNAFDLQLSTLRCERDNPTRDRVSISTELRACDRSPLLVGSAEYQKTFGTVERCFLGRGGEVLARHDDPVRCCFHGNVRLRGTREGRQERAHPYDQSDEDFHSSHKQPPCSNEMRFGPRMPHRDTALRKRFDSRTNCTGVISSARVVATRPSSARMASTSGFFN